MSAAAVRPEPVEGLIPQHLDLWIAAIKRRSTAGRGSSSKIELYGIKKLRELILELAVRGLLVQQDPKDEPASELLKKIASEKAKLVNEGKIKKEKLLPALSEKEAPRNVPVGWAPTRLGTLFLSINSGGTPSKSNPLFWGGAIPWASVKDLGSAKEIFKTQDYISEAGLSAGSRLAEVDDLLICTRMGLGKIAVVKAPMAYNQDLKAVKLTTYCSVGFFLNAYATLNIKGTGTTVEGIKQEQLLEYAFALPPLAEQHRIVAKVDELMALCDQLEQQTDASLGAHQTLVATLLNALTSAADHAQFASSWKRIAEHFDILFTTEESIDQLKQTILQLAVMGKLVPQDPNDEPASELLKKIAADKAKLVKEGKCKKESPLPPIRSDEKITELPLGWIYCRLEEICVGITSGSTPPQSEFLDTPGVPYLKVYNIRDQAIDFEYKPQFVSELYSSTKLKKSVLYPGDVVMNIVGPPLGKVAIIPDKYPRWNCNQAIVFFRPTFSGLGSFIYTYLKAGLFLNNIELIGSAGQDNISVTKSRSIVLPMPPLAEQQRIVAKVDELMVLCDNLKARLADVQTTQLHLADALAEQALVEA